MPQEHFKLDHHEFLPQPFQFIIKKSCNHSTRR